MQDTRRCRHCAASGHFVRECPKILCHACGRLGHFQNDCPTRNGEPRKRSRSASQQSAASSDDDQRRRHIMACYICGSHRHLQSQCPMKPDFHDDLRCFKCGEGGHVMAECLKARDRCFHCGAEGHMSGQCPFKQLDGDRICYHCHKPGHLAAHCPANSTCRNCNAEGHIQSRCPLSVCNSCHQTGHYSRLCPVSTSLKSVASTVVPGQLLVGSSLPIVEDVVIAPANGETTAATLTTALEENLPVATAIAQVPPPTASSSTASVVEAVLPIAPFEPQMPQIARKGRVAVIIDGSYFERLVVQNRKAPNQFSRVKELLKYTLDFLGNLFAMNPIAYWFDTDPNCFLTFVENNFTGANRDNIVRECETRKRQLLDSMNGAKDLSNVVAKLVGNMKRQKGYSHDGVGRVWVQTGVDVSIATCVIECFQDRRQYQQVVLVSGDSDLYPCVQYCNQSRRALPSDVPPVRVCGTSTTISNVYGQHQDLSDFLPRILLDEAEHVEEDRTFPFAVSNHFK